MGEASNFEIHNLAKHTLVRSNGAGCEEAVFWLARLDAPLKNNFYTILRKNKLPFHLIKLVALVFCISINKKRHYCFS
jgi:hypothetical protein